MRLRATRQQNQGICVGHFASRKTSHQNSEERCRRAARESEKDVEGSIMGPNFAWHRAETVPQRPPSKSIWPYRESERDEKGRRKTESSGERTGGPEQFTSCSASDGANFSDTSAASYAQRGDLQRDTGRGRKETTSENFETA